MSSDRTRGPRDDDRIVDRDPVDRVDRDRDGRVDRVDRDDRTRVVERVETRVDDRPYVAPGAAGGQVNVNTAPATTATASPVFTFTRVILLIFTVLEVLLLVRFVLKLLAANPSQPLVAGLYGVTDPLVRPFQGIFAVPADSPFDLAALLAILFLFLVAALIVALVRAIAGRSA